MGEDLFTQTFEISIYVNLSYFSAKDDVVDNDQESKMDTSGGPSDSSPVKSKEQPEIQDSTSEEADPSCKRSFAFSVQVV